MSAENASRIKRRQDVTRKERYLVHVINFSPMRNAPSHPQFCEDRIPLTCV